LYFENVTNFQKKARDMRYAFFDEVMEKENADYLVLAHHGDDNIETVLMRLMRGSSLIGYSGIADLSTRKNYKVIRPLLQYSKDDIINYQKMHKIKYYEDSSNSENDYTRNRIRHDIIPVIKSECNDFVSRVYEFSNILKEAGLIINNIRDEFISKNVTFNNLDNIVIDKTNYLALNDYMQEEVLFEILKKYALSKANIKELIKIIRSDKSNYKTCFKNKFMFIIEYNKIIIDNIIIINNNLDNNINNINIIINDLGEYKINDNLTLIVSEKEENTLTNKDEIWYNIKDFPITLRNRKPGDKIQLKFGYKKVKEILIDKKIPLRQREDVLILEKDKDILAIVNICKSVKLNDIKETNVVLRLESKNSYKI